MANPGMRIPGQDPGEESAADRGVEGQPRGCAEKFSDQEIVLGWASDWIGLLFVLVQHIILLRPATEAHQILIQDKAWSSNMPIHLRLNTNKNAQSMHNHN